MSLASNTEMSGWEMCWEDASVDAFNEAVQASLREMQLDIQAKRKTILDQLKGQKNWLRYTDTELQETTLEQIQMSIDVIKADPRYELAQRELEMINARSVSRDAAGGH